MTKNAFSAETLTIPRAEGTLIESACRILTSISLLQKGVFISEAASFLHLRSKLHCAEGALLLIPAKEFSKNFHFSLYCFSTLLD
ncbi:MAG: hypothetical protein IJF98_05445 [Firmicutes bacterium]|nr:hypothetical protein [Bacillota bacterium]